MNGFAYEVGGASKIPATENGILKWLLSKRDLASALNVSERTIENWLAAKKIPSLKLSARLTRFSLPKVLAALARYEVKEVGAA